MSKILDKNNIVTIKARLHVLLTILSYDVFIMDSKSIWYRYLNGYYKNPYR